MFACYGWIATTLQNSYAPVPESQDLAGYVLTAIVDVTDSEAENQFVSCEYTVFERITNVQFYRHGANTSKLFRPVAGGGRQADRRIGPLADPGAPPAITDRSCPGT